MPSPGQCEGYFGEFTDENQENIDGRQFQPSASGNCEVPLLSAGPYGRMAAFRSGLVSLVHDVEFGWSG